jgi:hypothetical protein
MMAYRDKMVVAVKVGGKILRENDSRVTIPFGSEFSILLKNLESRKASVKVSIDGKDVLNGRNLLIDLNSSMELERFIDDSMDRGNRFRFIQKTQEIADHLGDRIDDGIIRVEFAFEQAVRHIVTTEEHHHSDHHHHHNYWPWYHPWHPYHGHYWICSSGHGAGGTSYKGLNDTVTCNTMSLNINPDEGITVKGSESIQRFQQGYIGTLDPSEIIIIRLCGEKSTWVKVESPVFVKDKLECGTCGRKTESISKFCGNCGTALT